MTWNDTFLALFDRCAARYQSGDTDFNGYYTAEDLAFLESIGSKKREFFDFVEDFCEAGVPSPSTAMLIAAVRRDYFHVEQNHLPAESALLGRDNAPAKADEMESIAYLPRIIAKARAKLRGTLDPDLMFCCGSDRRFLKEHGGIHPADFLRQVWAAREDDGKILAFVKNSTAGC